MERGVSVATGLWPVDIGAAFTLIGQQGGRLFAKSFGVPGAKSRAGQKYRARDLFFI